MGKDTIYRQDAIDALKDVSEHYTDKGREWHPHVDFMVEAIQDLPSAQPEIIHCKECKYGVQDEDKRWYCRGLGCQVGEADGSGFCADAERRTG